MNRYGPLLFVAALLATLLIVSIVVPSSRAQSGSATTHSLRSVLTPEDATRSVSGQPSTAEPSAATELGTPSETGSIGYAVPSLGRYYLALPEGPGAEVRICFEGRCLVRTSTDAGPALSEQRLGRIGDLAFVDFGWLCRCSPSLVGRIVVSIERLDAGAVDDLPQTDTEP